MSKFCATCGNEVPESARICMNCGCEVESSVSSSATDHTPGFDLNCIGFGILGYLIPIVGITLFFVWVKKKRTRAICTGVAALISFIINIVIMYINK